MMQADLDTCTAMHKEVMQLPVPLVVEAAGMLHCAAESSMKLLTSVALAFSSTRFVKLQVSQAADICMLR